VTTLVEGAVDRDRLERLYLDYAAAIDDDELERWPGLFTEECSYRIMARENVRRGLPLAIVRCDSRGMLEDRVNAIRSTAFYVSRCVRHLIGMLDVRPLDEDGQPAVGVRASFAVYESLPRRATTLGCAGAYDDVVVEDADGRLRFRQKHCIYDGDLVMDSIVYPL
jgi:3-phenylpropionate/cinnamic acid dioxygenase small subunit